MSAPGPQAMPTMTGIDSRPRTAFPPAILALGMALLLAALLAYANSFSVPYLLDDTTAIQENSTLRKAWPLWEALSPPTHTGLGGRPVANLTFVLNYAISGESLAGFHTVNLLLHFLAALTLGGVVRRTLQRPALRARFGDEAARLALAAAGIWLLHPIQTQSVTYLSQRTEVLFGLCYLFCLYAFIRAVEAKRPLGWYSLAVLSALAGVASKESMVTVPVMILAYDLLLVSGPHPASVRSRRGGFYLALAGSWLLLALLMRELPDRGVGFGTTMSPGAYALIEGQAIVRYALRSVWPTPLIFDHGTDFPAARPPSWRRASSAATP